MSHDLVRQTKEKPRQSFGLVKERIVTMQPCSVIEDVQLAGECGGGLSLCGLRSPKVQSEPKNTNHETIPLFHWYNQPPDDSIGSQRDTKSVLI